MYDKIPNISEVMTPLPHTINSQMKVSVARDMMREHKIRHLPVLEGGKLVGVISDRDLKLALSFKDVESLTIEDVMTVAPYSVPQDTLLNVVLAEMEKYKYGSVIVHDREDKTVGIFTDQDAVKVLMGVFR